MDTRRLLMAGACGLALAGCSTVSGLLPDQEASGTRSTAPAPMTPAPEPAAPRVIAMAPIPNPPERGTVGSRGLDRAPLAAVPLGSTPPVAPSTAEPTIVLPGASNGEPATGGAAADRLPRPARERARSRPASGPDANRSASGRAAIAEANAAARAPSRADAFENGVQMFGYEPGRFYEVWTAPYRVTTLTLAPGETVTSKAAGDTVRWQIGETTSGSGNAQRTHVLVKPLERGLETNLVLTTSQRVYMILLRSGADDAFNAAVAWRYPDAPPPVVLTPEPAAGLIDARLDPERLDGRYRIEPRTGLGGRRPRWTPTAVFSDGARTVITFPPDLQVDEAPVLFVLAPDGEAQVVNYRQQGGVFVVDRLFDRAELRLGERRPQVVRISRIPERRPSR